MKSFARGVIMPTLLDMLATTSSSTNMLHIATFGVSHTGSSPFGFTLQHGFSCSLGKPKQRFCPLYAVWCVTVGLVGCYTCISRGRSPVKLRL